MVGRISDEGEETSILFQLLGTLVEAGSEHVALHIPHIMTSLVGTISKCIPPNPEPWSQVCSYLLMILMFKSLSLSLNFPIISMMYIQATSGKEYIDLADRKKNTLMWKS